MSKEFGLIFLYKVDTNLQPTDLSMTLYIYREVYDKLVHEGIIVPRPDETPPTVPMDYAWAQVGFLNS